MSFEHKFHKTRRCKFLSECTCVTIPTTVIKNITIKMKGLSTKMCHYQQYKESTLVEYLEPRRALEWREHSKLIFKNLKPVEK